MEQHPELHGETAAFADAHGQALLRLAYLLCAGDAAAAEDLVQSVLLRLLARGLDGLENPLAYARRALVNQHRDQLRRTQVQRRAGPRLVEPEASNADAGVEDRLVVLDALDTLSTRERVAVVLRFYEDLPDDQIAQVLGCSRVTVRSLVHRATPKLRSALAGTYAATETHP